MSENFPPTSISQWPPIRHSFPLPSDSPRTPLTDTKNTKRWCYQNGYEIRQQTPSYKPYTKQRTGRKRQHAIAFNDIQALQPQREITHQRWDKLAHTAGILPENNTLRQFQVDCTNLVLSRSQDVCVIAPTGQGKSMLWVLLLLIQRTSCSLVITPYTSLGLEGQSRNLNMGLPSVFVHAGQKGTKLIRDIAGGRYRVIFACLAMLESPAFAEILHSTSFQACISSIYINEAHLVNESALWHPAYTRVHLLHQVIGHRIPLITISATLPSTYRHSLITHISLHEDAILINLGNFHPKLMTVVMYMEQEVNSFKDLVFLLRHGARKESIEKTIVYIDNLEMLTALLWSLQSRLVILGLLPMLVDIHHAGLSSNHQEKSLKDFESGETRILLASEKIGAGINFSGVLQVVQYLIHGLTLVRWSQQHGRGARDPGSTAVGILLVEKKMQKEEGLSPEAPGNEDPGILELVQSTDCCQAVLNRHLENPPRPNSPASASRCCSNCYPSLRPAREYQWIMENPEANAKQTSARRKLPEQQVDEIYQQLIEWRQKIWREEWMEKWPGYGPKSSSPWYTLHTGRNLAPPCFPPSL
ncbi:hypothetical protein BDN67DRAFT_985334 [Paxillus ammoniavirescens]|nr:hypothetical protein BDN67DRAFT_985334 [Paxillus ammoniavirescens]